MDSLRYWLTEMHVDGFRFDLAATLARQDGGFEPMSAFFDLVAQDPVVSQAKLIAEPWDVGQMDSYDLGRFPACGGSGTASTGTACATSGAARSASASSPPGSPAPPTCTAAAAAADRLGQPDHRARRLHPARPGLLRHKHNEANGEDNRDGTERQPVLELRRRGPDRRPRGLALRARQSRAMLTTLLLSFGVPLLLGGDELGRTQAATTTPTARTTRSPGSTGPRVTPSCSTSPGAGVVPRSTRPSAAAGS
jgi:isoamylase